VKERGAGEARGSIFLGITWRNAQERFWCWTKANEKKRKEKKKDGEQGKKRGEPGLAASGRRISCMFVEESFGTGPLSIIGYAVKGSYKGKNRARRGGAFVHLQLGGGPERGN